jgi:C-terminal processing protease CtpA/Prc
LLVVPGNSPAAKAGLKRNDLVQSINGQSVLHTEQMIQVLTGVGSGPLKLKIVRNQKVIELTVVRSSIVTIETSSTPAGGGENTAFQELSVEVAD